MFEQSVEAVRLLRASIDLVEPLVPSVLRDRQSVALEVEDHRGVTVGVAVRPELGVARTEGGVTSWPLSWAPVGHKHLLPSFTGRLDALGLREGTRLALSGTYRPPLGPVGALIDRVKARELAVQSLDAFLSGIGQRIDSEVERQREAGPLRTPEYPEDLRSRHF